MRAVDLIQNKRQGLSHSRKDLESLISGYIGGSVPDYQIAAWLMAICWQGMSPEETATLTEVMAQSGDMLDLSSLPNTVDKHSTGGVGDKTSLILGPLLAACSTTVAKMSGRGLGHTGGTIDKLEAIPNFQATLSEDAFFKQAQDIGVVITGQSKDLAPADGLIYALRDATGTVQSLPLIASSIMSKKLAGGAQSMVLDVKVGSGAFMKTLAEAQELAYAMLDIGKRAGRNMRAVLSNMEEPLGNAVGNAIEVQEAIECLQGKGANDLRELCLVLAEEVLEAAGLDVSRAQIAEKLENGNAYEKFKAWVGAQGGDVDRLESLELAPDMHIFKAQSSGYLSKIDALTVGQSVKYLGGGRETKTSSIDLGVGIYLHKKIGDEVEKDAPILTVYHRAGMGLEGALKMLGDAINISSEKFDAPKLVLEKLS